jgi:hypothetical protein
VGGWILLAAGTFLAFLWFFWLLPFRHLADYNGWVARHSAKAYWEETQKQITRMGYLHDNGFYVGAYGDKTWAEWIIKGLRVDEDLWPRHKDSVLAHITNQDPGPTAAAWLAWWSTNQARTQEQWILDGFRQEDLELNPALTEASVKALLLT